eukprot:4045813-Amphidinium_carterae.2
MFEQQSVALARLTPPAGRSRSAHHPIRCRAGPPLPLFPFILPYRPNSGEFEIYASNPAGA